MTELINVGGTDITGDGNSILLLVTVLAIKAPVMMRSEM